MMATAWRQRSLVAGLDVLEPVDLPTEPAQLHRHQRCGAPPAPTPPWLRRADSREADDEPASIAYRLGDEAGEGILIADSNWGLLDLLRGTLCIEGDSPLARAARAWREGDRNAARLIEAWSHDGGHRLGRMRRRQPGSLIVGREGIEAFFSPLDDLDADGCMLWHCDRLDGTLLAAPVMVDYAGHAVERWQFLLATDDWEAEARFEHPYSYYAFDGQRGRWLRSLGANGSGLPEALLTLGRLQVPPGFDLLPQPGLAVRALLRVPARDEVTALPAEAGLARPSPGAAAHPALLRDARSPIELPEGLPVIDDPVTATAIIRRTRRGIYLPDDPHAQLALSDFAPTASWALLCEPRP